MRKNAGLKSKEEMKNALESGVVLFRGCDTKYYFSEERIFEGKSPYVVEYLKTKEVCVLCGMWDHYKLMEIETQWEDELKNREILCWVSNVSKEDRRTKRFVVDFDVRIGYISDAYAGSHWKYATPLTEEEAKQFIL